MSATVIPICSPSIDPRIVGIGDLMVKDLPKPGKPPLVRARAALKVAIDQGQTVDPIETVYVLAFVRALIDLAIADAQKRRPVV
jgi:hypothetical protein